jgi:tetratricopeptide (TPR) repeat protein
MKPDRFDILTLAAMAVLLACAVFFAYRGGNADVNGATLVRPTSPPGHEHYARVAVAKTMLDAGQVKESVESLKAVSAENPGDPEVHALLGQAYSKLLDYPSAVKEYRLALSLDADYVDQKSPKFIGKRIKAAVREAKASPAAGASRSDISYLERMLAGGCE